MKRLFLLFFMLFFLPLFISAEDDDTQKIETTKEEVKLLIIKRSKGADGDRSSFMSIEAWYDKASGTIELKCFDTKETSVYIVSASGEILSYDEFSSDISPISILGVPAMHGSYLLVIDSPVIYAEGRFSVN